MNLQDLYPDWHHYACVHCGAQIASRNEVRGRSYCMPECGGHLDDGGCPCVALRAAA